MIDKFYLKTPNSQNNEITIEDITLNQDSSQGSDRFKAVNRSQLTNYTFQNLENRKLSSHSRHLQNRELEFKQDKASTPNQIIIDAKRDLLFKRKNYLVQQNGEKFVYQIAEGIPKKDSFMHGKLNLTYQQNIDASQRNLVKDQSWLQNQNNIDDSMAQYSYYVLPGKKRSSLEQLEAMSMEKSRENLAQAFIQQDNASQQLEKKLHRASRSFRTGPAFPDGASRNTNQLSFQDRENSKADLNQSEHSMYDRRGNLFTFDAGANNLSVGTNDFNIRIEQMDHTKQSWNRQSFQDRDQQANETTKTNMNQTSGFNIKRIRSQSTRAPVDRITENFFNRTADQRLQRGKLLHGQDYSFSIGCQQVQHRSEKLKLELSNVREQNPQSEKSLLIDQYMAQKLELKKQQSKKILVEGEIVEGASNETKAQFTVLVQKLQDYQQFLFAQDYNMQDLKSMLREEIDFQREIQKDSNNQAILQPSKPVQEFLQKQHIEMMELVKNLDDYNAKIAIQQFSHPNTGSGKLSSRTNSHRTLVAPIKISPRSQNNEMASPKPDSPLKKREKAGELLKIAVSKISHVNRISDILKLKNDLAIKLQQNDLGEIIDPALNITGIENEIHLNQVTPLSTQEQVMYLQQMYEPKHGDSEKTRDSELTDRMISHYQFKNSGILIKQQKLNPILNVYSSNMRQKFAQIRRALANFLFKLEKLQLFPHQVRERIKNFQSQSSFIIINFQKILNERAILNQPYERAGSYIFFKSVRHNNNQIVEEMLKQTKYYIYDKDQMFMTPLHVAINKGNEGLVKRFIELGSDLDAEDIAFRTPLLLYNGASPWGVNGARYDQMNNDQRFKILIQTAKLINLLCRMTVSKKLRENLWKNQREIFISKHFAVLDKQDIQNKSRGDNLIKIK